MNKINSADFIDVMFERGFIHQITDKENLTREMEKARVCRTFSS